jgi:hypothetical protein
MRRKGNDESKKVEKHHSSRKCIEESKSKLERKGRTFRKWT